MPRQPEAGFTLAGIVRRWAADRGDAPALVYEGRAVTWAELDHRSSRVAQGLLAEGVEPGDRVAYLDKNGPSSFEVLFGTAKGNAVHVPVNWRLSPNEIAAILNDAGVRVLFVGTEFAGVLERFEAALTSVSRIVIVGGAHDRHLDLEAWLSGRPAHDPGVRSSADDLAMLLYTSGTTGRPKGAMLTNRSLAGLRALADRLGCDDRTVSLVAMPMFHIGGGGWALVALDRGGTDVVLREVEPARIVEVIERHRVTQAFLVPTVIGMVLAEVDGRPVDFSSLTTLAYGASPISETVLRRSLHAFGCGFVQLYGLTETTGGIVMLAPEDHDLARPDLLQSCGRPMSGVEVRVVDPETGEDLPDGRVGELWVRSGQNMIGYWEREAETRQTLTPDAWLRTGDAGYRDGDGYLFLHDRIKDMILSGGENVYPAEVENVLMAHPSVADVAVIGVPHEVWGEAVKALVVLTHGADATAEELIGFAREQLAGYKCPKSVDFVAALPRNASGKLLKRELRDRYRDAAMRPG